MMKTQTVRRFPKLSLSTFDAAAHERMLTSSDRLNDRLHVASRERKQVFDHMLDPGSVA